ncbi:MAG: FprA family A-type flavoprotein [Clostridiaceae bacterium]|nr:FprA family A-type flavoprotein [Clostridiaceae bacterium]
MSVKYICEGVSEVGAGHPDLEMFDSLMPTPFGTTYNSYLVQGKEKIALIDSVDDRKLSVFLENLCAAEVERIDYIISLHAEQDHSGTLRDLLERWPMARLVALPKAAEMLSIHLHLPVEEMKVMQANEVLDLGGKTLKFIPIPFAHWPDNTMLWLAEDRILFSSDLFGSHYAKETPGSEPGSELIRAARDYYAEIMMPFRTQCSRYTRLARELDPRLIAASHGPVWSDPRVILDQYERWTNDEVRPLVTIAWVTMHDSTKRMVEHLARSLAEHGIAVASHNVGTHPDALTRGTGHLMSDLVDAAALIIATPTVLAGPHPAAAYAALLANALRPKIKIFSTLNSYGWGGKPEETLELLTGQLKVKRLPGVKVKGLPTEEDYKAIEDFAAVLAAEVRAVAAND